MSTLGLPWYEPLVSAEEGDSDDQHTPLWLLELVGDLWSDTASPDSPQGIDTDPAHSATSYVVARLTYNGSGPEQDGLAQPWRGRVWCNPPYSDPAPWADKMARHHVDSGAECLLLVNVSTTVRWFRRWRPGARAATLIDAPTGMPAAAVAFFDKRIAFIKNGVERRGNDREQMLLWWGRPSRLADFRRVFGRVAWVVP